MDSGGSRSRAFAKNASVSVSTQILVIVLGFATRTVFVKQLGVAELGINTALTSLVSLLSIADLGINGALMFALYKPLKENDRDRVFAIVCFADRIFRIVALIVAVVGLGLMPFLDSIIRLEEGHSGVETYYLLLLGNVVIGYLMLSRSILLQADQKMFLVKLISIFFNVLKSIAQIISLIYFQSFFMFLAIQVLFTLCINLAVYIKAGKIYTFVNVSRQVLDDSERKSILASVKSLLVFRIAGLVLSNTPGLLISILVGTVALGYYSNYLLIISSVVMITEAVFLAVTPSVGNLVAESDGKRARAIFDEITLLSIVLHGGISVILVPLYDDIIKLWLGSEFVLSEGIGYAIVFNFYISGILMPIWSFRNATGLFKKTQWVMVLTVAISIPLAIFLENWFGIAGIVAAPAIARMITGGWYEPFLLVRDHLAGRFYPYVLLQAAAAVLWILLSGVIIFVGSLLDGGIGIMIVTQSVLALIGTGLVTWLLFGKSLAFKSLINRILRLR